MDPISLTHLHAENRNILELRERLRREAVINPQILWPLFRPCKVRVLLVVDGLDFSTNDFGLSTFVSTLLDTTGRARFEVTLAHLSSATGAAMMDFESRIKDRITNFKFDDSEDFSADRFDVVFLFGIETSLSRSGNDANGNPYPNSQFADTELQILGEFMNGGGGLFATGDHGALGRFMGQALPRARNMRLWDSTSGNSNLDEVSMGGPRRNDTNRLGDPGSQFTDQSDDIPQPIQPKMYSRSNGLFKYTFPHPLLCGPNGVIRVMPDHPHEGECIEPPNPNLSLNFTAPLGAEYPAATGGGPRPLPEIISTNSVLAGTTSGSKNPTVPHSFGGITAYDGHRAGVGRVVTDATWHHFVNINLVGDIGEPVGSVKSLGFLASASGQAHLEEIKTYFRNLATWMARPENISCMNSRLVLKLVKADRVLEAVLTTVDLKLQQIHPSTIWLIGRHARDVIGRFAGQCQTVRLALDLVFPEFDPGIFPDFDPWRPEFELKGKEQLDKVEEEVGGVQWVNMSNVLDMALGSALLAVNEEFGSTDKEVDDEAVMKVARGGARKGVELALHSLERTVEQYRGCLRGSAESA